MLVATRITTQTHCSMPLFQGGNNNGTSGAPDAASNSIGDGRTTTAAACPCRDHNQAASRRYIRASG